jgi:hypothetical protein
VTKFTELTEINLVALKAATERDLLFYKPASDIYHFQLKLVKRTTFMGNTVNCTKFLKKTQRAANSWQYISLLSKVFTVLTLKIGEFPFKKTVNIPKILRKKSI